MEIQSIKQRFGIIGNSPLLENAINIARQVAPTDISVLITGESGTGKEFFPQIIHQLSARKHGQYIAVNCGAIPEGTIDSELFGHEKGSFTGAHEARKGYFEVANGGTIFLDEVAELPLQTQVRLLRVLESGEFLKVGSSKVIKTNVRIIAATNINIPIAIQQGKFREDLYYRLNSVPIFMPPLRERKEDIILLFRKFASDFAEKYKMPSLQLEEDGQGLLLNYRWPGNIRQLKNITEQISIIEKTRLVTASTLVRYLPEIQESKLPVPFKKDHEGEISERDILYRVLFEMRKDISDLKQLVGEIIKTEGLSLDVNDNDTQVMKKFTAEYDSYMRDNNSVTIHHSSPESASEPLDDSVVLEESLSLTDREKDLIKRALEKYKGKRKNAAAELGISERTLYRKIKEYDIDQ
ncbi:MAG: sigma-54 dependent transcriptional regulator [Bacteroidota bacterium]